jgi:hypothetical protein
MKIIKWKYIVWVGATPDFYTRYKDALRAYHEWEDKGYDDIQIEKIRSCQVETNTKVFKEWSDEQNQK